MATTARSTLVAVFNKVSDAEAAANELERKGIDRNDIYLSSEPSTAGSSASQSETRHEGGFVGWLKRVFRADDESDREVYENAYRSGNILLAVDTSEENLDRVAEALNRYSPIDIHRDSTAATAAGGPDRNAGEMRSIPVVEEEVKVGKRSVLRGSVRVYSRVKEQPVEETVRLREEKVHVERQPVDRPATEADLRAGREQTIEVNEYAEEPVVSKQARVSEEVRVYKEAEERTETLRETVRNTEVNVENVGRDQARASTSERDLDQDFRRDFATRYGSSGEEYETYSPAYRYGYQMAGDARYRGREFTEVEPELRAAYARQYPNSTWEKIKASVQYGWDKVTGRTRTATTSR